jgi:Ca2+-binding EF-hand superfamily protein
MDAFKTQLEKQLREKISQKANDKVSDEAYVIKAIKFYDIYNTGTVTYQQFHQALERIGIFYTLAELLPILSNYDPQQRLKIDYIEFSKYLYKSTHLKAQQTTHTREEMIEETHELLNYFRRTLAGRAGNGLISLRRIFSIIDQDKNGQISIAEFSSIMKEFKIELSNQQINAIFKIFDMNKDGTLSYDEFLAGVRGSMCELRLFYVNKAFDLLDKDQQHSIDIQDIVANFKVANHPAVVEGRKTEEQVLAEFLDTFEVHHNLNTGGLGNSRVSREEFVGYYDNVSATIGEDDYFVKLLDTSWGITGVQATDEYDRSWVDVDRFGDKLQNSYSYKNLDPKDVKGATIRSGLESSDNPWQTVTPYYQHATADRRSVASSYKQSIPRDHTQITGEESKGHTFNTKVVDTYDRHLEQHARPQTTPTQNATYSKKKDFDLAMDRFKAQVIQRGTRGIIGLKRQFKILDDENDGTLDMANFQKGLEDYNILVEFRDLQVIYDTFNIYGTTNIDYVQLLKHIIGDLSEFRGGKVELAWRKVSANQSDFLTWEEISFTFNASRHPAVKAGYVSEEEIQYDFEETFKALHSVYHSFLPDQSVTKDEFFEYFRILSSTVPNDKVFDMILTGVWNVDLKNNDPKTGGIRQNYDFDGTRAAWKYDFHRSIYGKLDNSPFEHNVAEAAPRVNGLTRPKTAVATEMPTAGVYSWPYAKKTTFESNVTCLNADNLLTRTQVLTNDYAEPSTNQTNGNNHY